MADEDPLYNNCIEPHSLCMRAAVCDYCGGPEKKAVLIEHLYGIQACAQHYSFAERDCKADLARNSMVRYKDAILVPECAKVLEILDSLNGFNVKRTSGAIDSNWQVRSTSDIFDPSFLTCHEGVWYIPCCNDKAGTPEYLKKGIPLAWFLTSDLGCTLPAEFPALCEAALKVLERGVYKAEFDAYTANVIHSKPSQVAEHPDVSKAIMPDGQIVRVLQAPPNFGIQ
jgi:hypothetical protein